MAKIACMGMNNSESLFKFRAERARAKGTWARPFLEEKGTDMGIFGQHGHGHGHVILKTGVPFQPCLSYPLIWL